ncbi:MAG: cytochrome c oxidase subunit 3 [Geminicoccaceae bacterium]|nr:cytochrome c oxidase subunit 3 [Geminicoccaceae bacterium]MDW8368893.1 cytochrome c oxidase subunit 3 [Geminicoccaceae bacterium]
MATSATAGTAHGHAHAAKHPYHLVDPSPWPLVGSAGALLLTAGAVMWMHGSAGGKWVTLAGFATVIFTMFMWWRDVLAESYSGAHTDVVARGLRMGMLLFITSEVFFFFAFFWAFFWGALVPPELEAVSWPPQGVEPVPTWGIPFLNTLILLTSGTTVTWAHHAIKQNDQKTAFKALLLTVLLGLTFTGFQVYEYIHAYHEGFTLQSGMFGSTFYMATGFHGLHVQIGTVFLIVMMMRAWYGTLKPEKHVGFEAAAWYWHFVDVVWLFLFVWVYWWGGSLRWSTTGLG